MAAACGFAGGGVRRGAQPRQHAITLGSVGRDFGEGGLGLALLALLGQRDRSLEGGPGLGGLLGLKILVAAPAADAGDDQKSPPR